MRDFDCPRYADCLENAARANVTRWTCEGCGKKPKEEPEPVRKEVEEMEEKKVCKKCGKEFPLTEEFFSKCGSGRYWEGRCKDCRKAYGKKRYKHKHGNGNGPRKPAVVTDLAPSPKLTSRKQLKEELLADLMARDLRIRHAIEVIQEIEV